MDNTVFQNFLRSELQKKNRGQRTDSVQLLWWVLTHMYDLDEDYAKSVICDGVNDKGIDALYVDDQEETIYIFQSKFKTRNDHFLGDRNLRDFSGVKSWFQSSQTVKSLKEATINEDLKGILKELKIEEKISDYKCEFHFVSNTFSNHDTVEFLQNEESMRVIDLTEMINHYHFIKDTELVFGEKVFQNISTEKAMQVDIGEDGEVKSVITILTAQELLTLDGIEDLTLFSKNVRYGLGQSRVNKSIKKTLEDPEENINFLLFHNGVSIVCKTFNFDEADSQITLTDYSVVNGAQTILTFKQNEASLDSNIKVIVKITQVGENEDLMESISHFNNNQNAISMRDLRSRDRIQMRLTREFENINDEFGTRYTYVPKRGIPVTDGYHIIENGYASQLISSCYLYEPFNIHLKASFFDQRYSNIFNKNTSAFKIIFYMDIHNVLKGKLNEIQNSGIADYGLAQHSLLTIMLSLYKDIDIIKTIFKNEAYYFQKRDNWNKIHTNILNTVLKLFNYEIRVLNSSSEDFVYKNFFKSKEDVNNFIERVILGVSTQLSIADKSIDGVILDNGIEFE